MSAPLKLDSRILELGITLPISAANKGNYVSYRQAGSLLYVSGQLCVDHEGRLPERYIGQLGRNITPEMGYAAAQLCLYKVLAEARLALGTLDRLTKCVRLGGFVNADPACTDLASVMNGASDAIVAIMGEAGRHSRTTIGVATLPLGACVEVEGLFETS